MPTTNPVPSLDPSDLLFNAGRLDQVVNGSTQYYTDRLGVNRRTVEGINAAADVVLGGIGYAPPVAYAAGISMTLTTQTVEYSGEIYAPKVASLPFTTSTWATDSARFRLIQGVSATDLAASGGSSMIGYMPAGTDAVATTVQQQLRNIQGWTVNVKDAPYYAKGDGITDDTAAIQAAVDYVKDLGGTIFFPRGQYSVSGGISATVSASVILKGASQGYLSAAGDAGGTKIIHTGDNTCFDFQAANIWASVVVDGFEVRGTSAGSNSVFVNYSDSWGSSFRNSIVTGYTGGTIVRLWNKTAWTEGFFAENLMLRDSLKAFEFKRTAATGGTDSFYRFSARNVNVVPGPNGAAFHMFSTAGNQMHLYGADIDVSLWFEVGGAGGFFIGNYCRFGDSTVRVKQDGIVTPGATDHFTFRQYTDAPGTSAQSFIDIEGSVNAQQSNYYYVNALPTGSSIRLLKALLKPEFPEYASIDQLSPTIRVKGAKVRFGDASQASNKTFVVDSLPALSNYRVTLTAYGINLVSKAVYEVAVYDKNLLADVRLVAGYADANVICRVFGGGAHHSFSAGNGLKFEVVVNAATAGVNISWCVEIEVL